MTEGDIRRLIGVDMGYDVKDGLIADRLLVWELFIVPRSPLSITKDEMRSQNYKLNFRTEAQIHLCKNSALVSDLRSLDKT